MGKKSKWFEDKQQAASQLFADIGRNNVKVYDVLDYQQNFEVHVQPSALFDKCTHVEVACSGDAPTGHDWLLIAPYRIDTDDENKKYYDIDPTLLVLDTDTGDPHPSGVAAYHQDFAGRTTPVEGFEHEPLVQTVATLRSKLLTGVQPLEEGSPQALNALAFMHKKFGPLFDRPEDQ